MRCGLAVYLRRALRFVLADVLVDFLLEVFGVVSAVCAAGAVDVASQIAMVKTARTRLRTTIFNLPRKAAAQQ